MSTDTLNVTIPAALDEHQRMAECVVTMLLYLAGGNPERREPLIRMCSDLGDLFKLPER